MLHFERFLDKQEDAEKIIDIIVLQIKYIETDCSVFSKEANEILDRYDKFCQETENEAHGKTGASWMNILYISIITLHVVSGLMILSCKFACLPEITNFFFAFNHVNYARWLVNYYDTFLIRMLKFTKILRIDGLVLKEQRSPSFPHLLT